MMNTLERLVSLEKRLDRFENFIKELITYDMNHDENCNSKHHMNMGYDCTCSCSLWLELQITESD